MNIALMLLRTARQYPDAVALRHGDAELTWAELERRVLTLAGALREQGLRPGDRVALLLANGPMLVESLYGVLAAGLTAVPLNARLHPREVRYIVEDCAARALIHGSEYSAGLNEALAGMQLPPLRISADGRAQDLDYERLAVAGPPAAPVAADPTQVAWLFYTSGTTGRPKGAMLTHRNLRVMVMNHLADVQCFAPGDVVLHAAPLTHGSGLVMLAAIAHGATNVIYDGTSFAPEGCFDTVQRCGVTHVAFLAPTQIVRLLEDLVPGRWDLSSLRSICYGGAPMHVEDLKRALEAFGPILVQIYGQGEAPMTISYLAPAKHREAGLLASAGIPRTDVEVAVMDGNAPATTAGATGEIVVKGDVVMAGYWGDQQRTADAVRAGWLHTGDVGSFDERGHLFIRDRSKDLIISGGNNIYPREVEEAILSLPSVAEVTVFGLPDRYWGERVHAVVVPREGATVTADAVITRCRERLASYKKPQSVAIAAELPKNAYGKVLKRDLRDQYLQRESARRDGANGAGGGTSDQQHDSVVGDDVV